MTREEAIKVLKNTLPYESNFAEARLMAIETLEYLEKNKKWIDLLNIFAESCDFDVNKIMWKVQEWIPCNERLPNEDGRYLVVYPLISGGNWISIKWFGKPNMSNRPIKGKCFYESDSKYGDVIWDNVIAWMPLPEPYKEKSEEESNE